MSLPNDCPPSEPLSGPCLPFASEVTSVSAPPCPGLAELTKLNPRYLTPDQRRALDGLYSGDDPTLRLRILRELSEAEQAQGVELARQGASVRHIVRALGVSRGTAATLWKQGRPTSTTPAPKVARTPAPVAPVRATEPKAAPVTPAPPPAMPAGSRTLAEEIVAKQEARRAAYLRATPLAVPAPVRPSPDDAAPADPFGAIADQLQRTFGRV
jgi:hypothetical protein